MLFQSTRPVRGATQGGPVLAVPERISIHAPHAGRDVILNPIPQEVALFQSTRPMRGATPHFRFHDLRHIFQSTRPMRVRLSLTLLRSAVLYFNPRAPCGARPDHVRRWLSHLKISIHAPHAGRDFTCCNTRPFRTNFYPRAPCGARPHFWLR